MACEVSAERRGLRSAPSVEVSGIAIDLSADKRLTVYVYS